MIETKYLVIDSAKGPALSTLAQLCAAGVDNGYTHVWVLASAGIDPDIPYFKASKEDWDLLPTWTLKHAPSGIPNHLRSVTGYRQKHLKAVGQARNSIQIIFCGPLAAWQWARRPDLTAKQALNIIGSMETLLGVAVSGSPGNTGYTYLQEVKRLYKNVFDMPITNDDSVKFADIPWGEAISNILWTRVPEPEELSCKYLIRIDKNAAFPRSSVENQFGCECVDHYVAEEAQDLWTEFGDEAKKIPGIWKIEALHGLADNTDYRFPPPLDMSRSEQWLTTPALKTALALSPLCIDILEAWLFPKRHYILRETMQNLWDFRQKFKADDPRNAAFKQIMVDLPGLFRMPELVGTPKYRPDWYAQITGGNFAIMQQNIRKFAELYGLYPVLCHIDCIMYCSDKPLSELMPDNRMDMGHYKHELQLEMTDEIRAILVDPDMGSAQKLAGLNRLADYEDEDVADEL